MTKFFNYIPIYFTLIFACTFNSSTYAEQPKYKLIDLGLQESDRSEAVAVNDNGQVAGSYRLGNKKYYYIWTLEDGRADNLPS